MLLTLGIQAQYESLPAQFHSVMLKGYTGNSMRWQVIVLFDQVKALGVPQPCMFPKAMGSLGSVWISFN